MLAEAAPRAHAFCQAYLSTPVQVLQMALIEGRLPLLAPANGVPLPQPTKPSSPEHKRGGPTLGCPASKAGIVCAWDQREAVPLKQLHRRVPGDGLPVQQAGASASAALRS